MLWLRRGGKNSGPMGDTALSPRNSSSTVPLRGRVRVGAAELRDEKGRGGVGLFERPLGLDDMRLLGRGSGLGGWSAPGVMNRSRYGKVAVKDDVEGKEFFVVRRHSLREGLLSVEDLGRGGRSLGRPEILLIGSCCLRWGVGEGEGETGDTSRPEADVTGSLLMGDAARREMDGVGDLSLLRSPSTYQLYVGERSVVDEERGETSAPPTPPDVKVFEVRPPAFFFAGVEETTTVRSRLDDPVERARSELFVS